MHRLPQRLRPAIIALLVHLAPGAQAAAQPPGVARGDTTFAVSLLVLGHELPLAGAVIRSEDRSWQTGQDGRAVARLARGPHVLVTTHLRFAPDTTRFTVTADTALTIELEALAGELAAVIVSATRAERRVEDTPIRVEVVDEEEIAEKVAMTPGDIVMMLNETSGLRVQTTSPSSGAAGVRVQGLRGRYTLLLADGLPLAGAQTGGIGLLQIPPIDLGRVEVIKGTANALYGPGALGGVINLVSRRPGDAFETELLLNQTSRDGTDGAVFLSGPLGGSNSPWGGTVLVSGHRQRQNDLDADAWTDMPAYRRFVVRPRLFYAGAGRTSFATLGVTTETRDGGTMGQGRTPDGRRFAERLRTGRVDAGIASRWITGAGHIVSLRGSTATQSHIHDFGPAREQDWHHTWFLEASGTFPRGSWTHVAGVAVQEDRYTSNDLPQFDYTYRAPAVFVQSDVDPAPWLALSTSARLDAHNEYGTSVSPRASVLVRGIAGSALAGWSARLSLGSGTFAPTPFTEEAEVAGLAPLAAFDGVRREHALSGAFDINGALESGLGEVELGASLFASRLSRAVTARARSDTTLTGARRFDLVNAPVDGRVGGVELLGRLSRGPFRMTATLAHLRSTEWDPEGATTGARRRAALVPRTTAGVVASVEEEERFRVGVEFYYTGRQPLYENPYRTASRPYLVVGLLAERWVETPAGPARLFVNLENIGDVRQTKYDPLLLPTRGMGGRWTTDAWTDLSGFTVNGGIRLRMPHRE